MSTVGTITTESEFIKAHQMWEDLEFALENNGEWNPGEHEACVEKCNNLKAAIKASPFTADALGNVYRKGGASLTPEILEAIASVPDIQPIETEDGFLIRPDSGEVVGHSADQPGLPFTIDSYEKADWALKLLSGLEGDIIGLQARRDALLAEMNAVISTKTRKLAYWDYRFRSDLTRYARTQLKGKEKTARFSWGHVSFRDTKGTNTIVSDDEAIQYVESIAPELVKVTVTKKVGVKEVLEAAKRMEEAIGEPQTDLGFMKSTGPGENITVSTGVMLEGKKKK